MIDPRLRFSTYEEGQKIMARKSSWMVLYLRARVSGDRLKGFFRKQHFKS